MQILQQSDNRRQVEIGVRPFVDLICHRHVDAQQEPKPMVGEQRREFRFAQPKMLIGDVEEFRNAQHECVAVDFDKVVTRDRGRVDVMLAKGTNEVLKRKFVQFEKFTQQTKTHSSNQRVNRSPRVRAPMHNAGHEIWNENLLLRCGISQTCVCFAYPPQ